MGTTNFDVVQANAFIGPVMSSGIPFNGGNVLFVDSNAQNPGAGTFDQPYSTLVRALAASVAGDTIIVKAGHAETVTGVGGLTFSKAGVTVVGQGTYNRRPRFLMDGAATVTALVSGANVTLQNLVFAAGHADVATCFDITAKGATFINIETVNNVVDENFVTPYKATGGDNTADGLKILNCRNLSADAAAAEFVEITGNLADLVIQGCRHLVVAGTASPLILSAGAKVLTNCDVGQNIIQNGNTANDLLIDNGGATNSGVIYNNYVGNLDVTGAQLLGAATGIQFFENYATSTSTESGGLAPAADTPNS
jgi:hypothetical protein